VAEPGTLTSARSSLDGLVDTLDRLLGGGAVVCGDLVITVAEIELIRLDLRLLLTGIQGEPATATGSRNS
jgi:gas vesicle protein GvpA/GvpJ/GvpM family